MTTKVKRFSAAWCGPCKAIAPVLDELAAELNIEVEVINVDDNEDAVKEYAVVGIPTLILEKDGVMIARVTGQQTKDQLKTFLSQ